MNEKWGFIILIVLSGILAIVGISLLSIIQIGNETLKIQKDIDRYKTTIVKHINKIEHNHAEALLKTQVLSSKYNLR